MHALQTVAVRYFWEFFVSIGHDKVANKSMQQFDCRQTSCLVSQYVSGRAEWASKKISTCRKHYRRRTD